MRLLDLLISFRATLPLHQTPFFFINPLFILVRKQFVKESRVVVAEFASLETHRGNKMWKTTNLDDLPS